MIWSVPKCNAVTEAGGNDETNFLSGKEVKQLMDAEYLGISLVYGGLSIKRSMERFRLCDEDRLDWQKSSGWSDYT